MVGGCQPACDTSGMSAGMMAIGRSRHLNSPLFSGLRIAATSAG